MTDVPIPFPDFKPGWVWLAGAGPGDPGLVTLHAWHALRTADVVVYDALASPAVLELARPDARREFVGKRGGHPSPLQPEISRRLIELAQSGQRVLRLKGGDPFVFGRGAEECLALVAAGVPFRVIPGISAGVGGLAAAGIPLTSRDTNQAVTFVTGHGASGKIPEGIDWEALAKGAQVIVLYMALRHLGLIAEALIAGGRPATEPVAVVANASLPNQRVLESQLDRCAADAQAHGLEPPAIVIIGPVVGLRALLGGG